MTGFLSGQASAIEPALKLMVVNHPRFLVIDARGGFGGTELVPVVLAMKRASNSSTQTAAMPRQLP
jgi:hypothetical protein